MLTETMREELKCLEAQLVDFRRDLHMHPELLYEEDRTREKIIAWLKDCGLEIQTGVGQLFHKGVVATLRGGRPGKTILLRADIDALPIQDMKQVPYRSQVAGKMHACGHDLHTTALLGAARVLAAHRDEVPGTVRFVFEPSEENGLPDGTGGIRSGGLDLVLDGVCDGVDLAFALHTNSEIDSGTILLFEKEALSASSSFKVTFHGRAGHSSAPQIARDAVLMGAEYITASYLMMNRCFDPRESNVLTYCTIEGGDAINVIADRCHITGKFRCFDQELRKVIWQKLRDLGENVAQRWEGSFVMEEPTDGTLATINTPEGVEAVARAAARVLGGENVVRTTKPAMCSEDFSYYLDRVGGAMFMLGTANREKGIFQPLHSALYDVDEDAIVLGSQIMAGVVFAANGD
ncbi:M20 metallopeptidase family protein [Feifania hominis]|uniref:Amidohydrolase n=1 Tax=Feifania hominis TaxID=2763660 RepID=A0A926DEV0_9FIRM|nr:M20 family metallopeptidase [Feifania hominis]MBC8536546.1 amidohydrolase [Feifania hominis]